MKYLILALALILPLSVGAYPEHLKKLKETNECPKCDLKGANLEWANLQGANTDYATMKGAILCNTTMPDGTKDNSGC